MRTTVDIDPHLLKRLREEAHRQGRPFKEVLTAALRRGLESGTRSGRRRYRCPTYAMGTPAPGVNLDRALTLAGELEDGEVARKLALRK